MKDLRIVFFGTPDFAAASLNLLVSEQKNVVAVVTAPDRPKGRGKKISISAVKEEAVKAGIPVLQPANLKSEVFISELASYNAEIQVVVAFRMLPLSVWDMPPLGTFNLHASLLPRYRGAAPINWAIVNGETETGVTTFFLKHEIDTGEIIMQEKEAIGPDDTAGSLYDRLMFKGADLVLKTVLQISRGNVNSTPQEELSGSSPAPKIYKQDCKIDWQQSAVSVKNFIRGMSPYPTAWSQIDDKNLKIFKVELTEEEAKNAGLFEVKNGSALYASCADFKVRVLELQIEGKRRMSTEDFLRGIKLPDTFMSL
ncbi:MAG: methionyl-tRNA formyltransferase [Bacteroidota bacterium]